MNPQGNPIKYMSFGSPLMDIIGQVDDKFIKKY